jgi:hypothetical protein
MDKFLFSPSKILSSLKRKNIALVYTFQNEDAAGFGHYDYWKFNVISDWGKAVEQLGCMPYVLDVRTFGHKVLNNSMPPIDFVINLNAGNQSLSTLGLVPSLAGFIGVPCIPNDTLATVAGESKILSNRVAMSHSIHVPSKLPPAQGGGIFRPDNYGSSRGISVRKKGIESANELYQEFIPGVDLTIPFLFNPSTRQLEALPGIMYIPENKDMTWFLGEKEKVQRKGYVKTLVTISPEAAATFSQLADSFKIKTLCRIDTRVKSADYTTLEIIRENAIPLSIMHFMEINAMPTISEGVNFCNAVSGLTAQHPLGTLRLECQSLIPNMLDTTFVLFCSICAHLYDGFGEPGIAI